MDSAVLHVLSKASIKENEVNVSVNLKDMPRIGELTEEAKGMICLEILKRMKEKGIIDYFVYTEDSGDENVPDRIINLV